MPSAKKPTVKSGKVADLLPDDKNANKGTERGDYLLRQSVEVAGIGRGIVADRNGKIIGGNKTHATVGELGLEDVILVQTDGNQLVVTQRTDLDLDAAPGTPEHDKARTLAIADNRAGEVSLSWDAPVLADYADAGIELDDWFHPNEIGTLFEQTSGEWGGDESSSGGGAQGESEGAEGGEKPQQPTGMKTPLAIALTSAELKDWNTFKESRGIKSDTTAFLALLDLQAQAEA